MTVQTFIDEIRKRPGTGGVISVINPVTEEQITESTDCGAEAVNDAVDRAKIAFEAGAWSELPGRARARIMWRIADLIDEHAEELAQLDSLNTGMPLMQARWGLPTCAEFFRYHAGWCSKISGNAYEVKTAGIASDSWVDMHTYTVNEPYSVVGLNFPWNGPIFNACAKLAPALAAGCSMVVKPAEETPLSALLLTRLIAEAGVPEGVVNLVTDYGHTAGAAITAHPERREGGIHGVDRGGQRDRAGIGGQPQEGRAGTRWQVPSADLRRRRHGQGRLHGGHGHLHPLRPGLCAVRGSSSSVGSRTRWSPGLPTWRTT